MVLSDDGGQAALERVTDLLRDIRRALRADTRARARMMSSCAACGASGATFRMTHGVLLCDNCDDGATHGHL